MASPNTNKSSAIPSGPLEAGPLRIHIPIKNRLAKIRTIPPKITFRLFTFVHFLLFHFIGGFHQKMKSPFANVFSENLNRFTYVFSVLYPVPPFGSSQDQNTSFPVSSNPLSGASHR